jgi:polyhydroxybutyrate depolymerase
MRVRALACLPIVAAPYVACAGSEPGPDHVSTHPDGSAEPAVNVASDAGGSAVIDARGGDARGGASGALDAATSAIPDAGASTGGGGPRADAAANDATPSETARDAAGLSTDAGDAGSTLGACARATSLKSGDNRRTLMHGGRSRSFTVYLPQSAPTTSFVPLVLDFHGNGSGSAQEASGSGWREKAEEKGFLVAYPDGVGGSWNVGNCCGQALSGNVDDVGFARAMIASVSADACVDARRVYATGISNGAGLAHRLACEAADLIAAIAATSADLVTDPCKPARPISELSIRGLNDTLVAYAGGNTGSTGWYSPGAKGTLMLWKDINRCTGAVKLSREYCETYDTCAAGVEVTLCSLPNTGHILYDNRVGFKVPDVAWELFERQRLP